MAVAGPFPDHRLDPQAETMAKNLPVHTLGLLGLIAVIGCGGGIDEGVPANVTVGPQHAPAASITSIKKPTGSARRGPMEVIGAPPSNK